MAAPQANARVAHLDRGRDSLRSSLVAAAGRWNRTAGTGAHPSLVKSRPSPVWSPRRLTTRETRQSGGELLSVPAAHESWGVESFATHHPVEDAPTAYERFQKKEDGGKVVFRP